MNKVLIVDATHSDFRIMSSLLTKAGYEPIGAEYMEKAKEELAKMPPGAVVVAAMKFTDGTVQELINWQKQEGLNFPTIAVVDNINTIDIIDYDTPVFQTDGVRFSSKEEQAMRA